MMIMTTPKVTITPTTTIPSMEFEEDTWSN